MKNMFTGVCIIWDFMVIGKKMRDERFLMPHLGVLGSKR